ncbi:ATP-binding protein [Actinomadura sp. 21ATH]|uniref:ATP-binding protein n=1 Tax=Actinomadura sp. 21ATH TaxID=1735444 RepID=UPI0035BF6BC2
MSATLDGALCVTLPGLERSAVEARGFVRDVLGEGHPLLDDVRTCVNEAFTNAVEHTASGRGGLVSVRLAVTDGVLVAEVGDDGGGGARPRLRDGQMAEDGRGMRIIDALASDWGVRAQGGRCVVWMRFVQSSGGRRTCDRA